MNGITFFNNTPALVGRMGWRKERLEAEKPVRMLLQEIWWPELGCGSEESDKKAI